MSFSLLLIRSYEQKHHIYEFYKMVIKLLERA